MSTNDFKVHVEQYEETSCSSEMKILFQSFTEYFEQRMSCIDRNDDLDRNRKNEEKLILVRQHVKYLEEQNETLISTMVELEKEANKRVKQMDHRLKSTAKTTMESAISFHECEKEMRKIIEEKFIVQDHYHELQKRLSAIKVENRFLRDQNFNLTHDVQALLDVIQHARSTGHWEMDCLTFCEVTPEQVFGPIQSILTNVPACPRNHSISESVSLKNGFSPGFIQHADVNLISKRCGSAENECKQELPSVEYLPHSASLSESISLPEIGNIYHFTNCLRKSHSYNTFNITEIPCFDAFSTKHPLIEKTAKDNSNSEKHICPPSTRSEKIFVRKSQSEPYLFLFEDNIYEYKPCEPIKKPITETWHLDSEKNRPPCQSIDLKFPTGDSDAKLHNWARLPHNESFSEDEDSYCKEGQNSSLYSCSVSEDNNFEGSEDDVQRTSFTQTDISNVAYSSYATQTENCDNSLLDLHAITKKDYIPNADFESMDDQNMSLLAAYKAKMVKAENKAEAKEILLTQLQDHLSLLVKEVDQKNRELCNLEKKLNNSQTEVSSLKLSLAECLKKYKELETFHDEVKLTNDLNQKRLETELFPLIDLLKNQKSALMIQVEQQSQIIRSLQDALVQAKRTIDASKSVSHAANNESATSLQKNQNATKSSIINV